MITLPVIIGHVGEPDVVVSYISLTFVSHLSYLLGYPPNLLNIENRVNDNASSGTCPKTHLLYFLLQVVKVPSVNHIFVAPQMFSKLRVNFRENFCPQGNLLVRRL